MTWGWVHNFPAGVDVFTKPIDYPNVGFDTMIANWWQDGFDAVEDIENYLLGGILKDRGDPAAWDFTLNDFIRDGGVHDLDLSPWKRTGTTHFLIKVEITLGTVGGGISFMKKGNTNWYNVVGLGGGPGQVTREETMIVACDSAGKIQYAADNIDWVVISLLVRGDIR